MLLTYLQSGEEAEQRQSLCPAPWAVCGVPRCVGLSWGMGDILATRFWANSFRSLNLVSSTVEEVSVRIRCRIITASLLGGRATAMRLQISAARCGHPAPGGSFGINE